MLSLTQIKLIAVGCVLLALLVGGLHLKHVWEEAARAEGQAIQEVKSAALIADQAASANKMLAQSQDMINQLQKRLDASSAREDVLVATVRNIQGQRQQAQTVVEKLPDSAVKADLEIKLQGPLEDPSTLRRADVIITDYPLLKQELATTNSQVGELKTRVDLLDQKVTAVEHQRDIVVEYGKTLLGQYKQAVDLLNKPKRRAWCLGLCKTKDKILLPAPVEMPNVVPVR